MAELTFKYWTMWSWKSLDIIKTAFNYKDRWLNVFVFNHLADTRFWKWFIASRASLKFPSIWYDEKFDFKEFVHSKISKNTSNIENPNIDILLIDEAQFLSEWQVDDLMYISTFLEIPIICYWLRTDYKTKLFPWSKRLLELATNIEEITNVCWCWSKATINCKINNWNIILIDDWKEKDIWGDEKYISLCYLHYKNQNIKNEE